MTKAMFGASVLIFAVCLACVADVQSKNVQTKVTRICSEFPPYDGGPDC